MIASLSLFILIFVTLGYSSYKEIGAIVGFIIAVLYLVFVYIFGARIILRGSKHLEILDKFSSEIKEFNPQIYLSDSLFSLPPKIICVSQPVLDKLNKAELESIIMREIVRIKSGDVLKLFFLKAISGPLSVLFAQEDQTHIDYETAKITGDPETLANALEKLYFSSERIELLRKL